MEIIQERLEREYNLDLITTAPSVIYRITKTDGTVMMIDNPTNYPDPSLIIKAEEPVTNAHIYAPSEYVGNIMELCQDRRGTFKDMTYIDADRVDIHYELPLAEIIYDFFDTLIKNPIMWNSYLDHFGLGMGTTLYYTTDASVNPQSSYHYARLQVNTAGNLLSAFNRWMKEDEFHSRTIWDTAYSQFIRAELTLGKTWRFGHNDEQAIATRLLAGAGYGYGNSSALPFEQQFYSGGANSLRGWQARSVGPGRSEANDFFVIPNQTGDVKLEANVEYRFNMFWKLYGALFIDAGNIWVLDDYATDQQFRWDNIGPSIAADWGFGLRVDLNFILVRLDTGFITRDPSRSQPWTGPDQWFRRGGYAIHFGVGYPF